LFGGVAGGVGVLRGVAGLVGVVVVPAGCAWWWWVVDGAQRCGEFGWEVVVPVDFGGVDDVVGWLGVVPAQWGGPVAGAVGVAGVGEAAAVFGAVVMLAFLVQQVVVGAAAGGFPGR